ncbi:Alpha-amylase/trypsin inhibitor [Dichanthelium oligosanthes]|uniref:Alpha-amylase/trypsin inhibitor n=1 Tax=Dichanthelium oligosanthes TaxID=888268 RepID=A0A1E5W9U9_9POAL|nr:Alpha-amylase/trypsin inhibitor [Dichanthelium oligosanthes]
MASTTTTGRLLLSATALLAVLLSTATAGGGCSAPSYCASGQAIPQSPLPGCRWYVASQTCGKLGPLYPAEWLREMCCQQLEAVPAECRCRALRVMMEETTMTWGGDHGRPICSEVPQAQFAPAIVTKAVCDLMTIHGRPFCYKLDAE